MIAGPNAVRLTAPFKLEGHELRHEADFVVREGDIELGRHAAAVVVKRPDQAGERPIDGRDVVVARHDQRASRQPIEEGARLFELPRACTLSDVAGNDDEIRSVFR